MDKPWTGRQGAILSLLRSIACLAVAAMVPTSLLWISGCHWPLLGKKPVHDPYGSSVGSAMVKSEPVGRALRIDPNTPGLLRVNHNLHVLEQEMECDACHEISATGRPTMPDHDTCVICHDIDIDSPNEDCLLCHVLSTEDLEAQAYDEIAVTHVPESAGFHFDHSNYENDPSSCVRCHANAPDSRATTDHLRGDHSMLFPVVRSEGLDPSNCLLCHKEMDGQTRPESHSDPLFMKSHGKMYAGGDQAVCLSCHTEKQCQSCHQQTKPESHHRPEWRRSHGKVGKVNDAKCLVCHTEQACQTCHQQEMPEDHTHFFRRRSHGKIASWDRERCLVCHTQDYCQACHIGSAPRITRQDFHQPGRPCLVCHSPSSNVRPLRRHGPLPESSCLQCHQFQ